MGAAHKILAQESIATGITVNKGRGYKLRLRREHDTSGFDTYILENIPTREELRIPRFLFEMFRGEVRKSRRLSFDKVAELREMTVEFKGRVKFRFELIKGTRGFKIVAVDGREGLNGSLACTPDGLAALDEILFDERIEHGSDVLRRILSYHKLFKFTFAEGSESLNSGLSLRTDVLSQVEDYVPPVGRRAGRVANLQLSGDGVPHNRGGLIHGKGNSEEKSPKAFKSRLAERDGGKAWKVDYQALFAAPQQRSVDRQPRANAGEESKKEGAPRHAWLIPLLASEIKAHRTTQYRCELSVEEMQLMRSSFLEAGKAAYFLGFDIVDAIYKTPGGKLKTFRFPLHYMPVEIQESGRQIIIEAVENGRIYLNHLALATMVEAFTPESNPDVAISDFFNTLLAQRIDIDGRMGRVYLSRVLPCAEEVFERTREVLLGLPGENGKGGILSNLEIVGAECDTDAAFLYKASRETSPLQRALEWDLEEMQDVADRDTERFTKTLPGRFLSGSGQSQNKRQNKPFCAVPYVPTFLPPSTRRLVDRLNGHDVVLLEGPPGTGKTHTIMNLLIHGFCTGQRVLIVSDQEAALHALQEKMEGFIVSGQVASQASGVDLWRRAVKMVDKVTGGHNDLSLLCRTIEECLGTASPKDTAGEPRPSKDFVGELARIDGEIDKARMAIRKIMDVRMGPESDLRRRVSGRRGHATTESDIHAFVSFLRFMGGGAKRAPAKQTEAARRTIRSFVIGREYLSRTVGKELYEFFGIPQPVTADDIKDLTRVEDTLVRILKMKPRSVDRLSQALGSSGEARLNKHLYEIWLKIFPPEDGGLKQAVRVVTSFLKHPARGHLKNLLRIVREHRAMIKLGSTIEEGVWRQLHGIHVALAPDFKGEVPLSLEVCRFVTSKSFVFGQPVHRLPAIQEFLERLEVLEEKRGRLVRERFMYKLVQITYDAHASVNGGSNALTQISSMLHGLKSQETLESAVSVWRELQEKLLETFPIWLCRKQAVSFLFPCREKLFDLVIVDEATQCRVDDALPLMYRARKFMVVGDDKQTVLAKDSVIDDYLFAEFNLEEHLRSTQARGIKGGGSHIFGLIKGIKEASVMLDEHYRCPPAIIEYSNRYVYNSELRVMQWLKTGQPSAVVVDWSERNKKDSDKPESGAFKSIETDMIDRFLVFVEKSILDIEKTTGKRINMETDVALCYFLLKNEPYVKACKADFLRKLGRGNDVLDGAGAALQGKERPYIFYLWDISRSNMMAFRQGDDPDKRKGELNVLMSRPKRRAYHFLHKYFDTLDHDKSSITDYLWNAWNAQHEGEQKREFVERVTQPGAMYIPWRRSSGQLMSAILQNLKAKGIDLPLNHENTQTGVVVGDPRYKVDLVVHAPAASLGVVDLCGFDWQEKSDVDVVDYYFQLRRAEPRIQPIFLFMHELADERSRAFRRVMARFGRTG